MTNSAGEWQPEPGWPSDEELLLRVVRGCWEAGRPRWAVVVDRFAVGSTLATALCIRFDLNPDEIGERHV